MRAWKHYGLSPLIFIVDDHHDSADYLARLLRRAGYPARTFGSAREVLTEVRPHELPRLLVLDVMMPEMSGTECLRTLRQSYTSQVMPVIMYTADVTQECRQEAMGAGAQEFLVKGTVRWPQFLAVVQRLIGEPAAAQVGN